MSLVESGVTGQKPAGGDPKKKPKKKKTRTKSRIPPSEKGTHAYSIPQAGRMIGLSKAAAYEAAKRGEIPTQTYGGRKIVPKRAWDRQLGIEED